jgi:ornithine carbamoyltransferase
MRHLLTVADLARAEIERIFAITEDLKTKYEQGLREALLPGRVMALVFEKPSLRTRVSFEAGMINLGGSSLFLGADAGFRHRESVPDFARVLSQYVDVIVVRAHRHETVAELAEHSACGVINGLTELAHPCQAMADLYTLRELVGELSGQTLVYVGDSNNVARSLVQGCARLGMRCVVSSPKGYGFSPEFLQELKKLEPKADLELIEDPRKAVARATAVYTDVWASMGQEAETEARKKAFAAYQVNAALMAAAPKGAYFMHCLPAHRGEEVTDEVIDGPQSVVVQEAANRLHVQKGILAWMMGAHS